jgi:hypothetical protein
MTRYAANWPTRLGAGLFLALLLGQFASPPAAQAAGCGDHLLAFRVGGASDASHAPILPAAPCTGPSCSRPEQAPLAPATSTKITLAEQEARLTEPPPALIANDCGWLSGDAPSCPARTADPIFHPPR